MMNPRSLPRWRIAGAILIGAALTAAISADAHPAAPSGARDKEVRKASTPVGPGRISAALRHALRTSQRTARPAPVSSAGTDAARTALESLARHFVLEPGEPAPRATFKAILTSGSEAEIAALRGAGAEIRGRVGRVVSFYAPLDQAERYARIPGVRSLDIARRMKPELDVSVPATGADAVQDPNGPYGATGAGVLVASIDTGHDLKHRDFRKADRTTRFQSVYNMSPSCRGNPPPGHSEGCYYTEARINKFLKRRARISYKDPASAFGHGTHTLGIAAGNGLATGHGVPPGTFTGMAPTADLIGVRIFNGKGVQVGDITEALQFLMEEQERLGYPALVVSLAIGHQFGAHDGTDPDEIAIDEMIDDGVSNGVPRVVVKSAGNANLDDIYVEGSASVGSPRSHTFTIPYAGLDGASCGTNRGRGNDVFLADMWYPGDADITLRVTAPDGTYFENGTGNDPNQAAADTSQGTIFVDCPGAPYPENGDRECVFGVDDTGGVAPKPGLWSVTIAGDDLPSGGEYDVWIAIAEKGDCYWGWDDPTPGSNISIPGTAFNAITVGAYVTKTDWYNVDGNGFTFSPGPVIGDIADFSSTGPTRDGRIKPDITAPGFAIASARAGTVSIARGTVARQLTAEDGKHFIQLGTSMSAPHVAGAAALLLEIDPSLDAPTLRSLLADNAAVDGYTGGVPNDAWGYGKLDVSAAAGAARTSRRPLSQEPQP